MGCDIHVMVEARDFPGGGSATWRNVDNWRHNPYFGVEEGEGVAGVGRGRVGNVVREKGVLRRHRDLWSLASGVM